MTLFEGHLDQITISAKAISDLEFPPPKIFTHALLGHHEITSLIRDTEPHERSLFTVDSSASKLNSSAVSRRSTLAGTDGTRSRTAIQPQQRHGSTVAKVLGNDMLRQIQQSSRSHGRSRGIDVEVLLRGAERLCTVYPVAGARERISKLRSRHSQVSESISHYEKLVLVQQAKVHRLNNSREKDDYVDDEETEIPETDTVQVMTVEDLRAEEDEIRELEAKKKALEDRVAGIEKDLGGLLR